ncbi:MAG: hypothetical protein ACQES4_10405 [Bacillota bacterium]
MKKYLIGLLIALAAGITILVFFNQGLFTAADEVIEPAEDSVEIADDSAAAVEEEDADAEEEVVADTPDEEAAVEEIEPEGGEGGIAADDAGFMITETPYQDFIQARQQGEPIVIKFYSPT